LGLIFAKVPVEGSYMQIQDVVKRWKQIPAKYSEKDLELNLVQPLFQSLNLEIHQIRSDLNLGTGSGLKPDRLIYRELNDPPVLVVEVKKRVAALASAKSEQEFRDLCNAPNSLYREAVGYPDKPNNNGICQYLDNSNPNIKPNRLASYGLVFNGDFFQLWRRVEGLVFPLTPIQRVTATNLPTLIGQLKQCLNSKPKALVTAIWNQKGGVAKTTNTLNVGATLALKGKKVLFLDLDTQNDLTRALGYNPKKYGDYLEACLESIDGGHLERAKDILSNTIQVRNFPTSDNRNFDLHILPGEQESQNKFRDDISRVLRDKVKAFQKLVSFFVKDYDYIFIDISPAYDHLTVPVLYCCDTILIPTDYSRKALHHAVTLYMAKSPKIRRDREKQDLLNVGPWNLGLVYSNCPPGVNRKSRLEKYVQKELTKKGFSGKQCQTRLIIYAQTKLAEYQHRPVICWQNSQITKLYHELTEEVFLSHNFIDC